VGSRGCGKADHEREGQDPNGGAGEERVAAGREAWMKSAARKGTLWWNHWP
jgi:hypothetical protein